MWTTILNIIWILVMLAIIGIGISMATCGGIFMNSWIQIFFIIFWITIICLGIYWLIKIFVWNKK